MAYVFFIISALMVVTQQMTVKSSQDNTVAFDRKSWNMPDFSNNNRGKNVLLVDREPWIPSKTSQLTFLSPSQPLRVELKLNRDAQQSVIESCDLLIKCHARDTSIQQALNLISNNTNPQWKVSNPLCTSELGFVVEIHNITSYGIKMLPESKVPFNQSLEHHMEFSIRIRYKQGTLISAELYAFSLNSLFNINSQVMPSSTSSYRRFFLTWDAIEFLMGRNFTCKKLNTTVVEINFLEKDLLDVVKRAPNIIRQLLTVTVSLNIINSVSKLNDSRRFTISNGEENFIDQAVASSGGHNVSNDVRHGLSLLTGKLLIDRSFLFKISQKWEKEQINVTLRIALNGLRNVSEIEKTVTSYEGVFIDLKLPSIPSGAQQECRAFEESKRSNVTAIPFYTGMHDIVLTAQGVCPCQKVTTNLQKDCKSDYSVQYKYEHGGNYHHPTGGSRGIRRFQDKKRIVTLKGPRGLDDMGHYVFVMRDMPSHEYQLIDANLPMFEALPEVINVNKYVALELECTLRRTSQSYKSIHMSSHFQILDFQTGKKWTELNLDEFATKWLRVPPNKIRKTKTSAGELYGYKLVFPAVDHRWGMFRIIYICRAEITVTEVKSALGISKYQFEVRAPLRYHGFGELIMRNSRQDACSLTLSQTSAITAVCLAVASIAAVRLTMLYY